MSSAGGPSGTESGQPVSGAHARARTGHAAVEAPLERTQELTALEETIAAATASEGRVVLLEGAGGIGKTLLLGHAIQRAQASAMTVLRARGGELERQFPFGVALQLFEPYLSAASPRERRRVLAGAAAHAAPLLSGDVTGRESGAPEFPLLHGLHWVVANIAERQPLLITVDDAHSADDASLRALLFVAQRIEDLPLAIVMTARPRPSASTGSADALSALATHPLALRLELQPLSEQAITTIVRRSLPDADDAFCAACARVTNGNPFFLRELLGELRGAGVEPAAGVGAERPADIEALGPLTIAQAVDTRIRRLSPGAPALAHAVAVLGDDVPLAQAAALAQLDAVAASTAADELAGADVLHPAPELGFVHPIVRQAVYLGIPTAERGQLHLAAAELLRGASGSDADERAAAHLLQTLPVGAPWVVTCLHAAARRALAGGAPDTAASYLLRALDESPPQAERAGLLVDLGRAEALAGLPSAVDRLRTAVALLELPAARASALAQLGQALYAAGDNAGAASAFDEGLRVLDGADTVLEEQLTAGYLGAARLDFRTRETAQTRFRDLLAGSTEAATPAQRELLAQRALEHAMLGNAPADEVISLVRHAHAGGELLREATADGVAWAGSVATLLFCDALNEVEQTTSAGLEDARRRGSVIGFAVMSTVRGASRYLRGDLTGALGDLEGGLERVPLMVLVRPFAHGWMALAHIDRGEYKQAHALVGVPDEEADVHFTYNWSLFARGRLALAEGKPERALDDLLECGRRQLGVPAPNPGVLSWRSEAALAAHRLGRVEQARALADEELELSRVFGSARALGVSLRAVGMVTEDGERLALLEEAAAVLEQSPAQLELARTLVDLGAAQHAAGQRTVARETLRNGLDIAHHASADGLAATARAALVAAGARPRRPAVRGTDALTPSERRVAELAERGLTNREIAQALFVSTKTVEFHLRNAYFKLRISSRNELGNALHTGVTVASEPEATSSEPGLAAPGPPAAR
ncbi:MAG TPA: AAA family ATPase [Conexibacter sp.]|nr:AAA family ATPase [Conexibacter sp.]